MMQTITGTARDFSGELENEIARYRHKIFIERLGWQLPVVNGMERDQFDRADTLYVIARDGSGAICGCARLLPTTHPYLLGEVFPNLLADSQVPRDASVWELSRFAVAPVDAATENAADAARNTRTLLAESIRTAAERGARRLISVSPLGIERLLNRMGVHAHRAGPPVMVDGKPIFACWIELDEQTLAALDIDLKMDASPAH